MRNTIALLEEFRYRQSSLQEASYLEVNARLHGLYDWMRHQPEINAIIEDVISSSEARSILQTCSGLVDPPDAKTIEEIAGVGLLLLQSVADGGELYYIAQTYHIRPGFSTSKIQEWVDAVVDRFVSPAIAYVDRRLQQIADSQVALPSQAAANVGYPLEITESLRRFQLDHPDPRRVAFIIMQFGTTRAHSAIVEAIRATLLKYGIAGVRADDKQYHDDLFPNVQTYMYGCGFGISLFERLEADNFNPNVSLEVGYMRALKKPVCLLKDKTLAQLPSDLVGKLYRLFDPQDPAATIPTVLDAWLHDKDILT